MKKRSIAVVGAGASGMMAAVTAARCGAEVTIYEHRGEAGRKLLMTGNGKCNLTNRRMGAQYYHSGSMEKDTLIRKVFSEFDEERTRSFFEEIGLLTYDRDGYVYPQSEQAVSVRDVLVRECLFSGVSFSYDAGVYPMLEEEKDTRRFLIGKKAYDRLILACGGKSERQTGSDGSGYEIAKRFGHRICTPFPALVPLYTDEAGWREMAGVRAKARLRLFTDKVPAGEAAGELQFTAQGISGIPVFELSRNAVEAVREGKRTEAEICFLSGREPDEVRERIRCMLMRGEKRKEIPYAELIRRLTGIVNNKILAFLIKKMSAGERLIHSGQDSYGQKDGAGLWENADDMAAELTRLLFSCRIGISGYGNLDHAQVTSGGVRLDEVDGHLQSRLRSGLFFAGEIMDVDGICGGYNLQWAWSSGYTAGKAAACGKDR